MTEHPSDHLGVNIATETRACNAIVVVMSWRNSILSFVVTVTVTCFRFSHGNVFDSETVVQRPSSSGRVELRGGRQEPMAPTRHGLLTFTSEKQSGPKLPHELSHLVNARLRHIAPSVQCGNSSMTLKVNRVKAPHFLVDSGEGFIPFSKIPPKCGFSVKRSRRDVHFAAPYQGCHVTQQDGNYVLPLRLWGTPMTMSCPTVSLPSPSVSCFPSGMVVKLGGITTKELKVKVSGTWKALSLVCSSCGFAVEVHSGGLTLTAPYNRGPCVEFKDDEYLLFLMLVDIELFVKCPALPDIKPTTTTTVPPRDGGPVWQYPQYPQFPVFPKHPMFPGPNPIAHTPESTTSTVAQFPQGPKLPSGAANTENKEAPATQQPAFPFMPQFPQYPQYPLFLQSVLPPQSTADQNTAAPLAQLPHIQQSLQYPFPFFSQFPMVPGIFHPTTPPSPSATSTKASVTTLSPTTKYNEKPQVPQQSHFPVVPEYPYLPFPKLPQFPAGQTPSFQKPGIQMPKPHVYPQKYQIPVLYPPPKYPSQKLNTQTAAPATTSTTSAATVLRPAAQKPIYHPHMTPYYLPQQVPILAYPGPPVVPPANPAQSNQHEQQPVYPAIPPFYPFPSHQSSKLTTN